VDRRSRIHLRGRSIEIIALIDDAECKVHLVGIPAAARCVSRPSVRGDHRRQRHSGREAAIRITCCLSVRSRATVAQGERDLPVTVPGHPCARPRVATARLKRVWASSLLVITLILHRDRASPARKQRIHRGT
jgi:hypothetical protein